jgi:alpha-2-macroglobulin
MRSSFAKHIIYLVYFLLNFTLIGTGLAQSTTSNEITKNEIKKYSSEYDKGNYKIAYEGFKKILLSGETDPELINIIPKATNCLAQLSLLEERDELLDATATKHAKNWNVLATLAEQYRTGVHWGYLVAGKFYRSAGYKENGRYVNSVLRDRIRALQLLNESYQIINKSNASIYEKKALYLQFASILTEQLPFYKLQIKSDLEKLPDYDEGYHNDYQSAAYAPTDKYGNPIYYSTPNSFESSENDGQRFRWLLNQASLIDPQNAYDVDEKFAAFLLAQFGSR